MRTFQSLLAFIVVFVAINWINFTLVFVLPQIALFFIFVLSFGAAECARRHVIKQP